MYRRARRRGLYRRARRRGLYRRARRRGWLNLSRSRGVRLVNLRRRITNSRHAIDFRRLRGRFRHCHRRLLDTDNPEDRAIGSQLHMRTDAHFDRRGCLLPIHKRAESGVRVSDGPATVRQTKLSVASRHHRPLVLRKEEMTDGGVTAHKHHVAGERAFAQQLAAAIFSQNNFHNVKLLECGRLGCRFMLWAALESQSCRRSRSTAKSATFQTGTIRAPSGARPSRRRRQCFSAQEQAKSSASAASRRCCRPTAGAERQRGPKY